MDDDFDITRLVAESRRQFGVLADEARVTLLDICLYGTSETARIAAAKEILDRGVGKPVSQVELSGRDGGPVEMKDVTESARSFTMRMAKMASRSLEEDASSPEEEDGA